MDIAKENLTRLFSMVGICERFEEVSILMAKTLEWKVPSYEKLNYEFGKKPFDKSVCKGGWNWRRLEGYAFDPEARTIEE